MNSRSPEARWKTQTKNGLARTGRAVKGALRTVGEGAKRLREHFHHDKASQPTAPCPQPNTPEVKEDHHMVNQTEIHNVDLPKPFESFQDSEEYKDVPQIYVHRTSTASSISFSQCGRRASSVSHMTTRSSARTSIDDAARPDTGAKESGAPTTLDAVEKISHSIHKKATEVLSPSPIKVATWPRHTSDETGAENPSEQELENRQAKNNIFIPHLIVEEVKREPGQQKSDDQRVTRLSAGVTPSRADRKQKELRQNFSPAAMTRALMASQLRRMPAGDKAQSAKFIELWEKELLPAITQILDINIDGGYSVNVRTGKAADHQIIDVLTTANAAQNCSEALELKKAAILPEKLNLKTSFKFRGGKREHCVSTSSSRSSFSTNQDGDDAYIEEILEPRINVGRHDDPQMGDSVGPTLPSCRGSATLGPSLRIANAVYRLLNWHIFDDRRGGMNYSCDAPTPPWLEVVHPSLDDLSPGLAHVPIGHTVAFSGRMYKTTRVSRMLHAFYNDNSRVTTDWVLCETKVAEDAINKVRHIVEGQRRDLFSIGIVGTADPPIPSGEPGPIVFSTGRSSGFTFGRICKARGCVKLDDGSKLRDWAVESIRSLPDPIWNVKEMGVGGDSGAGIIDCCTNKLLGQLWGRDKYEGNADSEPRMTYFTTMSDIYDDIQERWPGGGCPRPTLTGETDTPGAITFPTHPPLTSIPENVNGLDHGSIPHGIAAYGPWDGRRSNARTAKLPHQYGSQVVKSWVTFPHAKTWPMKISTP
ncbi:hypothetical protein TruAng_007677 [Truncatella angustata]|nr:hypothetical protein TruAng_007677 [Truncatella angustata]